MITLVLPATLGGSYFAHAFPWNTLMGMLKLGFLCGLVFGLLAVAVMIPMKFEDKRAAMLGAFVNRFAIGLLIPLVDIPMLASWQKGLAIGLLLSLPDAIITKAWVPILVMGAIGGAIIGWIALRYGIYGI